VVLGAGGAPVERRALGPVCWGRGRRPVPVPGPEAGAWVLGLGLGAGPGQVGRRQGPGRLAEGSPEQPPPIFAPSPAADGSASCPQSAASSAMSSDSSKKRKPKVIRTDGGPQEGKRSKADADQVGPLPARGCPAASERADLTPALRWPGSPPQEAAGLFPRSRASL